MSFNWATLFLLMSLQGFAQLPMDSLKGEQFSLHKTSNLKIQSADFTGSFSIVKGRIGFDFDSLKVEGFDLVVDVSSLDLIDPVNRSDFNIGSEDAVSNEVTIHAEIIAYKKKK